MLLKLEWITDFHSSPACTFTIIQYPQYVLVINMLKVPPSERILYGLPRGHFNLKTLVQSNVKFLSDCCPQVVTCWQPLSLQSAPRVSCTNHPALS